MKKILEKIYFMIFPSSRILSELSSFFEKISSEQNTMKQKIDELQIFFSQQLQAERQKIECLENEQKKCVQDLEFIRNKIWGLDGLGKHLNIISNTQNGYHQESLGYLKDQIKSINIIVTTLALCNDFLQKNAESNQMHYNELNKMIESKNGLDSSSLNGLTEKVVSIENLILEEAKNRTFSAEQQNLIKNSVIDILRRSDSFQGEFDSFTQQIELLQKRTIQSLIQAKWQISDRISKLNNPNDFHIQCPLCGHLAPKSEYEMKITYCIFGGGKIERYVCPACDLIFGPLKMLELTKQQLMEEYKENYIVFRESDTSAYEIALFYDMKPEKTRTYLNYGAGGWNNTTQVLRDAGYQVYDYEPFAPVPKNDWTFTKSDDIRKMQFDGIFSNDLLEHLQNPVEELLFMKSILKKDGKMYHATGCYEYSFEYTRFHLFFFTGRSLHFLGEKTGFDVKLTDRIYPEQSSLRYGIFTMKKN